MRKFKKIILNVIKYWVIIVQKPLVDKAPCLGREFINTNTLDFDVFMNNETY